MERVDGMKLGGYVWDLGVGFVLNGGMWWIV
jgi:hypothetical protein